MKNIAVHEAVYELTSEDLTGLGGPMMTTTNFRRYFRSVEGAKLAAEKDYRHGMGRLSATLPGAAAIKWRRDGKGWTSGDLRFVMYTIMPVKIED